MSIGYRSFNVNQLLVNRGTSGRVSGHIWAPNSLSNVLCSRSTLYLDARFPIWLCNRVTSHISGHRVKPLGIKGHWHEVKWGPRSIGGLVSRAEKVGSQLAQFETHTFSGTQIHKLWLNRLFIFHQYTNLGTKGESCDHSYR